MQSIFQEEQTLSFTLVPLETPVIFEFDFCQINYGRTIYTDERLPLIFQLNRVKEHSQATEFVYSVVLALTVNDQEK
jgi:hypothetical protein